MATGRPDQATPGPSAQLAAAGPGRTLCAALVDRVAFHKAKNTTGAGEARNRVRHAVERTVPFTLFTQSIVVIWYHLARHSPRVAADRRARAPWYTTKTHPSYLDMITKLRRVLIAAQYRADPAADLAPEEIHTIRPARADTAA